MPIDRNEHAAWHGVVPMSAFFSTAEKGRFLVEGEGCRVRDADGNWYLDARSALWNVAFGYSQAGIVDAITGQLQALPFAMMIRYDRPPEVTAHYANRLAEAMPFDLRRLRIGSNGAQMTETAVLLSRFVRLMNGERDRMNVVALWGGYHGAGGLASGLTGETILHELLPVMPANVHHIPPPAIATRSDLSAGDELTVDEHVADIRGKLANLGLDTITALILEPVLGTGSVPIPEAFLAALRRLCDETGMHLIFDEITTGFGRVGSLTRCQELGIRPDMLVLGKGMSGGYVPLAALAISEQVYDAVYSPDPPYPFPVGSTADGHPIAAAAGLAVLDLLDDGTIYDNVRTQGALLTSLLDELRTSHDSIVDTRGVGLIHSIEFATNGEAWDGAAMTQIRTACEDRGVLINTTANNVALVPPLIIDQSEIHEIVDTLDSAISTVTSETSARV